MTPATAFLKAQKVAFTEHTYEYVEHGGTEVSAQALGVPEHDVVKTLVMEDEERKPLIVLMHGDRKVSTKNLARQAGRKSRRAVQAGGGAAPYRLPGRRHLALRHEEAAAGLRRALDPRAAGDLHQRRAARAAGEACAARICARVLERHARSTSLYRDADELGVGEDAELRGAHLDPGAPKSSISSAAMRSAKVSTRRKCPLAASARMRSATCS